MQDFSFFFLNKGRFLASTLSALQNKKAERNLFFFPLVFSLLSLLL